MNLLLLNIFIFILLIDIKFTKALNCTEEEIRCERLEKCDLFKTKCSKLCDGVDCSIESKSIVSRKQQGKQQGNLAWLITPTIFVLGIIFSIYRCYVDGICKAIKIPLGTSEEIPNSYLPLTHVTSCPSGADFLQAPTTALDPRLTQVTSEPCNGCRGYSPLGSEGMLLHNSNSFHILPHFKTQAAPPSYEHAITNNHEIETNIDGLPAYNEVGLTNPSSIPTCAQSRAPDSAPSTTASTALGSVASSDDGTGGGGGEGTATGDDDESDGDARTQFEMEIASDENYDEIDEYEDTCALLSSDINTRGRHLSAGMPLRSRYFSGSSYRRTCDIDPFSRQRHRSEPIYY